MRKILLMSVIGLMICTQMAFAGQIGQNEYGFFYMQDDGTLATSKWIKIDLNGDGVEEDCYFNEAGLLDLNAKPENSGSAGVITAKAPQQQAVQKENENTENVDPTMIPPKAQKAIAKIRDWCNEDGAIIIPYSKKAIKSFLKVAGYKSGIIDTAISNCNVDWNEHAVIFANGYKGLKYTDKAIKELMKIEGFSSDEIKYGLKGMHKDSTKIYINPLDYAGLTREQKLQKLMSLGLSAEKAQDALVFVDSIQ